MLDHEDKLKAVDAGQVQVSARDLVEALASLDARRARQDYEQVGTVTLAEGIQGCSTEATPEELQAEVEIIREADAARNKVHRRERRLRLLIKAEIVSAVLSLLMLVGLKHTLFDRNWQASYQAEAFQKQEARQAKDLQEKLRQSTGPNPDYDIDTVPMGHQSSAAFPLYCLPDGYDIHSTDALNNEGHYEMLEFTPFSSAYVEFREHQAPFSRDNVVVFYNGLQYRRGWVRKQDIAPLLQGKAFDFYPSFPGIAQRQVPDIVPVTISMQSLQSAGGQWGQTYPEGYDVIHFAEGQRVLLDEHAW